MLPYLGAAKLCPMCAVELGERLSFQPSTEQLYKAVERMERQIGKLKIKGFYATEEWLDHIDLRCSECYMAARMADACSFGKLLFLRHFAPTLEGVAC